MIQLVYVSSATSDMSEANLIYLLEQCRVRNVRQNVTGMLLYAEGNFIQVLEGDAWDVEDIYESILRDPRHTGAILIDKSEIKTRTFPNWSMGFKHLNPAQRHLLPGYNEFLQRPMTLNELVRDTNAVVALLHSFREFN